MRALQIGLAALLTMTTPAWAAEDDAVGRATAKPQTNGAALAPASDDDDDGGPSVLASVPALARIAKARDALAAKGIAFGALYLGDLHSDVGGGLRRGTDYAGRLDVHLDVDAQTLVGLGGVTLHANMFQIHGRDVSKDFVGNILSINDIAALPTTRLYELWVEQRFGDRLAMRVGQQGIDVEFLTSRYAATFVNATFGWPGLPTANLPDGGPAYPLATPAVRLRYEPLPHLAILAAVFDGVPAGPGPGDPQARDRYGLTFRVTDPPLLFVEAQYRYGIGAAGLPGTVKLGSYSHFGRFADQRFGTDGLSLAAPASNGVRLNHTPDVGFYGIVDQMLLRLRSDDPDRGVGVFARAIGSPGAQNLVDVYVDAGLTLRGLLPSRPADTIGLAATYADIAPAARAFDRDVDALTGQAFPVRTFEAAVELTYVAQIVPGLTLQPDVQYIVHPGGTVANPYGNGLTPIRDALVVGVATQVRF